MCLQCGPGESSETPGLRQSTFGRPDLLTLFRRCFVVALRTFLVPRVFLSCLSPGISFFLFASPLDILALRSFVRLDVGELSLLVALSVQLFSGSAPMRCPCHCYYLLMEIVASRSAR